MFAILTSMHPVAFFVKAYLHHLMRHYPVFHLRRKTAGQKERAGLGSFPPAAQNCRAERTRWAGQSSTCGAKLQGRKNAPGWAVFCLRRRTA
jgi:hypothetical protein